MLILILVMGVMIFFWLIYITSEVFRKKKLAK